MGFNNRTKRDMPTTISGLIVICALPIILNMTYGQELDPFSEHTHEHFNESVNETDYGPVYTYEPYVTYGPSKNENREGPMPTKETTYQPIVTSGLSRDENSETPMPTKETTYQPIVTSGLSRDENSEAPMPTKETTYQPDVTSGLSRDENSEAPMPTKETTYQPDVTSGLSRDENSEAPMPTKETTYQPDVTSGLSRDENSEAPMPTKETTYQPDVTSGLSRDENSEAPMPTKETTYQPDVTSGLSRDENSEAPMPTKETTYQPDVTSGLSRDENSEAPMPTKETTYQPIVTSGLSRDENSEAPMTTKKTTHQNGPKCVSESYQPEEPQCNNKTFTRKYHAYTCDGRCDDPNINVRNGPYCSCHRLCLISKDCCVDFQTFCWEAYKTGEQMRETIEASESFVGPECTHLLEARHTESYWIVKKCPKGYPNPAIKFKCEGPITEFTQIVPVASKATGLSYKNYYCAQCNNLTDIIPWGLNVTCKDVWEGSIDSPQTLVRYVTKGDCQLTYMSHIGHRCLMISQQMAIQPPSCHGNWLGCSEKHVHLCENGFQMPISVSFWGLTGFKNIHCVICRLGSLPSLRDIHCSVFFLPGDGGGPTLGKFSFGILVDFDPTGGSNVGFDFKDSSKVFGCKMNTPESSECMSYCPDGYDYINGQCVFRYQLLPMEVSGKWYSPGLKWYLDSHLRQFPFSKDPKSDIVAFLSDMLDKEFIVDKIQISFPTIDVIKWNDANQMVHFKCVGKYKLKANNMLSKAEIHANLFNVFVNHVKHYPRNPELNLYLLTMCFKMFQRESCWNYGRINHYGE
ncbi:unnamed protein product, partial [Owenia fusiformis]